MSFLCSFSWTSFNLLDSSMRLAHSQSHSLTLSLTPSLYLSLSVVCHLSVPMLNAFHDSPFLTPCLFFPFCFVPCSGSGPTIVVYIYIMVLPFQYAVPALHIISSRVVCHLSVPMFNAYRSFLAPFQLPLSLPFYLVCFSCPLACVDILQVFARGSRTSLVSPFLSV